MEKARKIALIILSIIYMTICFIIPFVGEKHSNIIAYIVYIIIIYVPFFILMILNKRIFANIILGVYMIIQFVTNLIAIIMAIKYLASDHIFNTSELISFIAYLCTISLSLIFIFGIINEFFNQKENKPKYTKIIFICIITFAILIAIISLVLVFVGDEISILSYLQSLVILIIEVVYFYVSNKSIQYYKKEKVEKRYTVKELLK